jgi:hypothetical protein
VAWYAACAITVPADIATSSSKTMSVSNQPALAPTLQAESGSLPSQVSGRPVGPTGGEMPQAQTSRSSAVPVAAQATSRIPS